MIGGRHTLSDRCTVSDMAKNSEPATPARASLRLTVEDRKLVDSLKRQLGVEITQLVRLGVPALAKKEGLAA